MFGGGVAEDVGFFWAKVPCKHVTAGIVQAGGSSCSSCSPGDVPSHVHTPLEQQRSVCLPLQPQHKHLRPQINNTGHRGGGGWFVGWVQGPPRQRARAASVCSLVCVYPSIERRLFKYLRVQLEAGACLWSAAVSQRLRRLCRQLILQGSTRVPPPQPSPFLEIDVVRPLVCVSQQQPSPPCKLLELRSPQRPLQFKEREVRGEEKGDGTGEGSRMGDGERHRGRKTQNLLTRGIT